MSSDINEQAFVQYLHQWGSYDSAYYGVTLLMNK